MESLFGVVVVWVVAPLVMLGVSAAYFAASPVDQPLRSRITASAHGVVGTVLFLGAMAIALVGSGRPALRMPYLALWVIPAALAGVSVLRFRGRARIHFLLLPLALAMLWALAVGYTVVGGGK